MPTEGRVLENILEPENHNSDINTEQKQQEILPPEELQEIRSRWEKHFETVYNQNISERKYQTKVDRKVNQKLLNTVDRIVDEKLKDMYDKDGVSLWDLNVVYYTSAVTTLETNGKLREIRSMERRNSKPGWQIQLEQHIDSLRRRLSFTDVILKCKEQQRYTTHQRNIEHKLKKWYGKMTKENLKRVRILLKQDLTAECEKLRKRITVNERQRINRIFSTNAKSVYRKFRAEEKIQVSNPPDAENVRNFWNNIWGKETPCNMQADWIEKLEKEYCQHVTPRTYELTMKIFKLIISRMPNNKAPGADLIVMFWIKKLSASHQYLLIILKDLMKGTIDIPSWLGITRTMLTPKNKNTHQPENYRPIVLQNNMYKVYTSVLNYFLQDHCEANSIITHHQAAA